jgi:hypothetical protein
MNICIGLASVFKACQAILTMKEIINEIKCIMEVFLLSFPIRIHLAEYAFLFSGLSEF